MEPYDHLTAVSTMNNYELNTGLVAPNQMVPELLRLGSLNGNLTGMAFSKEHWRKLDLFREDWRHAADWEWMIRASEPKPCSAEPSADRVSSNP